jgi:hypothetical protein
MNRNEIEMKIKELKELLRRESVAEAAEYDGKDLFRAAFAEELQIRDGADAIHRFLCCKYRAKALKLDFDYDVSLRSVLIYTLVWEFLRDGEICPQEDYNKQGQMFEIRAQDASVYRGDTMTSFWTPYRNAIQLNPAYYDICSKNDFSTFRHGPILS